MNEKIEYNVIGDLRTETVSQEDVSITTYEETVPYVMRMENQVLFSSEDEKLIFTSTPGIHDRVDEDYKSINSDSGQNLRERRKACHRVHYSSDLDESNHISYEGKKRSKKRRMSLLQSLSTKEIDSEEVNLDTLENHLFPDISFSESEMSYNESCFNTSTTNTDITWSKLQGVAYSSKYDFSDDDLDVNRAINHPNRSFYRQKRREWYLNRRNSERTIYTSWWRRCFKLFIQMLFVATSRTFKVTRKITRYMHRGLIYILMSSYKIFRFVFLPVIFLLRQIYFIFTSIKTKLFSASSRLFISTSKESVDDVACCETDKGKRYLLCSYFYCYFLLLFALLSVILIGYYDGDGMSDIIAPIPNPLKSGIANAYPVYITVDGSRIPAWHIYPDLPASSQIHPMKKSLKDMSPVVLYLRENGTVDAPKLKSVYQTLSSLGYHIVVPTNIPSQYDVLKVWKWIKAQNNATAYLWGYGMNAATLTVNAKLFCKNLVPPNGVIIAREIKNNNLQQSVEIWSCNCLLPGDGIVNGTELKYNHVKCPIAFNNDVNDVYSQVVACIETVNKDVK